MCGRYALALRPAQIRQMLQDQNMPVDEAPEDEGDGAPRQSYNFAPGYHGVVYRADVPHYGAGPRQSQGSSSSSSQNHASLATDDNSSGDVDNAKSVSDDQGEDGATKETHYKLQSMKWGLIPFWTKRNPDYGSMMKTINCRDDSLVQGGGMWSTMKARKRCIVVAQGFYEWLKRDGSKDKIPHFVKRRDGHLMCFAGLWDCVQYDDDEGDGDDDGAQKRKQKQKQMHYTYTIITTDSNAQLRFLHDRMPVILDNGSEALRTWLDPGRHEWTKELQSLLKPFQGQLEVYPVSKEVGKVGNNSPTFVVPIDSKENKSNIANFFAKGGAKQKSPGKKKEEEDKDKAMEQPEIEIKKDTGFVEEKAAPEEDSKDKIARDVGESLAKLSSGVKREADDGDKNGDENGPPKKALRSTGPVKSPSPQKKQGRPKISATSNGTKSPQKSKQAGTQKITKFFGNSS